MEANLEKEVQPAVLDYDRQKSCCTGGVTRREALIMAASASVLALLPVFKASADVPPEWVAVGKTADFKVGTPSKVTPAFTEVVYITRIDNKNLVAVSGKCTHRGCQVAWTAADNQFECPCHGGAFAANGKNNHGTLRDPQTPLPPLLSLPIRQNGDSVEVNVAGIDPTLLEPR
jgi:Rieske Fe-S protein